MAKSTSYTLRMTLPLMVRNFMSSNLVFKTFLFRLVKILFCQLQLYIFGRMGKHGWYHNTQYIDTQHYHYDTQYNDNHHKET
jgi:hypothetical protein